VKTKVNRVLVYRYRSEGHVQEDLRRLEGIAKEAPAHLRKAILEICEQIRIAHALGVPLKPGDELYALV